MAPRRGRVVVEHGRIDGRGIFAPVALAFMLAFAVGNLIEFLFLVATNAGQGAVAIVVDWFAIPVAGILAIPLAFLAVRAALRAEIFGLLVSLLTGLILIGVGSCAALLFLFHGTLGAAPVLGIGVHYAMTYGILWGALLWNCMGIRHPEVSTRYSWVALLISAAVALLWSCLFWFFLAEAWLK